MVRLRKIKVTDKEYFAKWWRDKTLIKVTSGRLKKITDAEVNKYFTSLLDVQKNKQYIITTGGKTIGHIALVNKKDNWYEMNIVIGEKDQQHKGYGTKAIKQLIKKAKKLDITKIYLEVRPDNLEAINVYEKNGFQKVGIKKYPKNKFLPQTVKMILLER